MWHSRLTQLGAIRDRAEVLVASGLADKIIAEKQQDRNDAWFEEVTFELFLWGWLCDKSSTLPTRYK